MSKVPKNLETPERIPSQNLETSKLNLKNLWGSLRQSNMLTKRMNRVFLKLRVTEKLGHQLKARPGSPEVTLLMPKKVL